MAYGLLAALSWGVADLVAAVHSRRAGSLGVLVVAQVTGQAGLSLLLPFVDAPIRDVSATTVVALVGIGAVGGLGFLSFYRGLALGPVSLVAPIAASYTALVAVASIALLEETLTGLSLAGLIVTFVGLALASVDPREIRREAALSRRGIPFAFLALGTIGVVTFGLAVSAQDLGWFFSLYVARWGTVGMLVVAVIAVRRDALRGMWSTTLPAAAVIGVLDNVGFGAYTRGAEVGLVSIVTAASAVFPMVPILGGLVLFGERLSFSASVGIALVLMGLVVLSLGR